MTTGSRNGAVGALVVAVAALAAAGCSSTAAAMPAMSLARDEQAREVFGDVERLQFAKQVQVFLPARLGVLDVSRDDQDHLRRRLTATIDALAEDHETWSDVGSVHAWNDERDAGQSWFEHYRAAASRQQADLLLVTERHETLRAEANGWAWTKILLLPMLFVPTEDVTTSVDLHTAAIDVRNGLVYATTDDHAERTESASVSGVDTLHREQTDSLFVGALPKLRETLARKLRALQGTR